MSTEGAGNEGLPSALPALLGMLMLDDLTRRAVVALQGSGVPVLVYKGRVNQDWLYDGAVDERSYSDVDLLVPPAGLTAARETLRGIGLRDHHAGVLGLYRPPHEEAWTEPSGTVDLHWGVIGIPPRRWADAWAVLESSAETIDISGHAVPCPGEIARALLVALQAAHSSPGDHARADLRRALALLDLTVWAEALRMAVALECGKAFVSGLSVTAPGCAVLGRLGRRPEVTLATALADRSVPYRVALWSVRALAGPRGGRGGLRQTFAVRREGLTGGAVARLRLAGAIDLVLGAAGYTVERRRWRRDNGWNDVPLER